MQTECPNCHTIFRITEAQLQMAEGMVRCGFCKRVFDARPANDDDDRVTEAPVETITRNQAETTETTGEQSTDPSADYVLENESLFSDTASDNVPHLPDTEIRIKPYSTTATVLWSMAIIILLASLAAEYIWFNQPELLQHQGLKPITSKLCELTDCTHLQKRDPSQIEMVSRNVYTHPNEKDALMISTTLVNNALFAQPYPDVQIDFSNIRGELVASRRFTPEEYLQLESRQQDLLQSSSPIAFGLEIKDPGKHAITYEFSFH